MHSCAPSPEAAAGALPVALKMYAMRQGAQSRSIAIAASSSQNEETAISPL